MSNKTESMVTPPTETISERAAETSVLKPSAKPLEQSVQNQLNAKAEHYMTDLAKVDTDSAKFDQMKEALNLIGVKTMRNGAEVSNRLLDRSNSVSIHDFDNTPTAKNITELRNVIEKLNPSKRTKFLGVIPLGIGTRVQNLIRKYESNQDHLNGILAALERSSTDLKLDVNAMKVEREILRKQAAKLTEDIYLASELDNEIETYIAEEKTTSPERAHAIETNILNAARRKKQELIEHATVMQLNYNALRIAIDTNGELLQNVERARTTTVTALRGALMMKAALEQQTNVAGQVDAISKTTSDLLVSATESARNNSELVANQSASTMIQLEALQQSFDNIAIAMENVDKYRLEANQSMKETINSLQALKNTGMNPLTRTDRDSSSSLPVNTNTYF